jgi:hypothetical protein
MISNDFDIISYSKIKNISVQTTAKILNKHIKNFILSSLKLNNIIINKNDKIFFSYIKSANIYEIYILNTTNSNISTQYHIFNTFYKHKSSNKSIDIFITKDFFVVYKESRFYFAKKNKKYKTSDIIKFIEYKYHIKIDTVNIISDILLKEYETNIYNSKTCSIDFISLKISYSLVYYLIYIFTFCILVSIFFIKENKITHNIINKKANKIYNKDITNDIIINLNKHNIYINKIDFDKKYTLSLYSKNIKNIYNFLSEYKNKVNIKSLYQDKNIYYMELELET